jgi:hypothetical protein
MVIGPYAFRQIVDISTGECVKNTIWANLCGIEILAFDPPCSAFEGPSCRAGGTRKAAMGKTT